MSPPSIVLWNQVNFTSKLKQWANKNLQLSLDKGRPLEAKAEIGTSLHILRDLRGTSRSQSKFLHLAIILYAVCKFILFLTYYLSSKTTMFPKSQVVVVLSLSCIWLFATPWTLAQVNFIHTLTLNLIQSVGSVGKVVKKNGHGLNWLERQR